MTHFAQIGRWMLAEFSDYDGTCGAFCPQPPEKNARKCRIASFGGWKSLPSVFGRKLEIRFWAGTVRRLILLCLVSTVHVRS